MWEGSAAAQRSVESPENGQEGAKASECHEVEKTEKRASHSGEVLLKEFLNPAHPLYRLADVVNWA